MPLSPFPGQGVTTAQAAATQFEQQKAKKAQAEQQAQAKPTEKPLTEMSEAELSAQGIFRIKSAGDVGFYKNVYDPETRTYPLVKVSGAGRETIGSSESGTYGGQTREQAMATGKIDTPEVASKVFTEQAQAARAREQEAYVKSVTPTTTQTYFKNLEEFKSSELKAAQEQKAFAESLASMTPEKATSIEKMLRSPTAEFSKEGIQKGYELVGKFRPDFKVEDVKAHLVEPKSEEVVTTTEKLPSLTDLGFAPIPSILGRAEPYTEKFVISPELISRMKGVDIDKVDVGAQLEKIKVAEKNLDSYAPLIKDGKFTGTNREFIEYKKAFDTYNKENKVLEDVYKAREKESLTTPVLKFTQDVSKSLQAEADRLIGVSKETTPGIRTGVSGASSIFAGLPAFAGQTLFSGEQIVRHPTEIVKIAEVGAPTFVAQTKEAAVQDPFRFGGSIVGMVALGEAGKVPSGIKSAGKAIGELEPASGITSVREILPTLKEITPEPSSRVADFTAGLERVGEIKTDISKGISKELSQSTRGKEALSATKEVVSDVEKLVSTEISRPTRGKQAFWSAKETLEEMKFGVEKEFTQPTRGKIAVKAVGDVISEFDTSIQKEIRTELRQPTRGTKAISAVLELTKEAVLKVGLSETERGKGLVELGKEIKYQLNRPAGGTLAEKNIVDILKMFPEKTVREVTPEELSKIQIPLEEVLKVPEKAREVYPYGRFSKLTDRLTTEGENLIEIPKARIPTPKSEIIKPIEELPEIPKARITVSEATKPEGKIVIKRDIQAELQKKWAERQVSMEKQAKEGGAQITKQGQILLTKQKMKPVVEKPVEVIDLTKMEQPKLVQKSITKMLELEKQAPVVTQRVKPKVVYVSAVQRMQQAQKEAQADLITGLQNFAPTITETKQARITIPVQVSGVKQRQIERQIQKPVTKEKQLSRQVEKSAQREAQITKQVTKQIERQVEVLVGKEMGRESFFLPSQQYREEGRGKSRQEKVGYVYKERRSPIVEKGIERLFGVPEAPMKPRRRSQKAPRATPRPKPSFDLGAEFGNPLGTKKPKGTTKKSNKNEFMKNVKI